MRFTLFDKAFDDISVGDLDGLREVGEGWYVEYKSQLPNTRVLAKSLSSFANQYGGWLFLGVAETPDLLTAGSFPGIDNKKLPEALEVLRNAAKDLVRPQLTYQHRTLEGPMEEIGLGPNRSVVVVRVPEGANTPYIHNDGRIYIRIGDSSSPIPAKDKSTFDLLYRRGENKRAYLKELIERSPEVSKAEEQNSYLHLSILSDPYETLGHWYYGKYSEFCEIMRGTNIPFDNFFTGPDGFIARQIGVNQRRYRLFTWEFSRNCNSFVTIPIPTLPLQDFDLILPNDLESIWDSYSIGEEFRTSIVSKGLEDSRILNLNILLPLVAAVIHRHRRIVGQARVRGPFYIKARIENVWRSIPFVDIVEYMKHVEKFDYPIVQASDMTVPSGTTLDSFVVSPELECVPSETSEINYRGPIDLWFEIMESLGIPGELLAPNANALLKVSVRESDLQRARSATR